MRAHRLLLGQAQDIRGEPCDGDRGQRQQQARLYQRARIEQEQRDHRRAEAERADVIERAQHADEPAVDGEFARRIHRRAIGRDHDHRAGDGEQPRRQILRPQRQHPGAEQQRPHAGDELHPERGRQVGDRPPRRRHDHLEGAALGFDMERHALVAQHVGERGLPLHELRGHRVGLKRVGLLDEVAGNQIDPAAVVGADRDQPRRYRHQPRRSVEIDGDDTHRTGFGLRRQRHAEPWLVQYQPEHEQAGADADERRGLHDAVRKPVRHGRAFVLPPGRGVRWPCPTRHIG